MIDGNIEEKNINERKSPEEIKKKILEVLNEKPLNALEISKLIGSNWSTVKNYVEELSREGKIKETICGNQSIYEKKVNDTYFNIPIKSEQREMFRFIFSRIISEYKNEIGRLPKKTELAKAVVEVVEEANIKDLPLVWYLYGKIPLMIADPAVDYTTEYVPENKEKLDKLIFRIVTRNSKLKVSEIKVEQYNRHNQELYLEKNRLVDELTIQKNDKKIMDVMKNLYLKIDIEKNRESFIHFDKIYFFAREFNRRNELEEERAKLILALENCWKLIALENFIESLSYFSQYNMEEIIRSYLSQTIEMQKNIVQEYIENLEEDYNSKLKESNMSKEAIEARKVMENWTGE